MYVYVCVFYESFIAFKYPKLTISVTNKRLIVLERVYMFSMETKEMHRNVLLEN